MKTFLIGAAAILVTTAVQAADMPSRVYAKAPVTADYNWNGAYVGVNLGSGWARNDVSYTENDRLFSSTLGSIGGVGPVIPSSQLRASGVLGGAQIGYNWQFDPKWLVGIEADFSGADIDAATRYATGGASPADISSDQKVEWFGTARARIGLLPTDRLLVYGTGGFAYGRVNQHASLSTPTNAIIPVIVGGYSFACLAGEPCFVGSSSSVKTGWTAGAGLEYALGRHLTLKAEYLHIDLSGEENFRVTTTRFLNGAIPSSFNAVFGNTNFDVVRAGLNYRF